MLEFRGGVSDPNGKFGGENHRVKKWRRLDGICDPSLWNQGQPVGMKDIRKTRKSWLKKKQSSHKKQHGRQEITTKQTKHMNY